MELAHSLLLNEEALKQIADSKKTVFVFEWIRFLDKILIAAQKSDIKESQRKLIEQLTNQISESPGPPTRKLLARCISTLFSVGDTFDLFNVIDRCNDIIKSKDDSPSYLPTRLAAIACLGAMHEKLGRMVGRSYDETIQILIKSLKNAESQGRSETMNTLGKVVYGLGAAGSPCYKDIYKACRQFMTDRSMAVRFATTKCMVQLLNEAPFIYTSELESVTSLCFRALDGSNYDVRCAVANLLGRLLYCAQSPKAANGKSKRVKIEDVLNLLASGFLRGGLGFLKTSTAGDMIKGSSSVNREVRVGITHAYVEFVNCMGGLWLERNISLFLNHVLDLVASPRITSSHIDAVYARKCVLFILHSAIGSMLGEKAQIATAKEVCTIIVTQMNSIGEGLADSNVDKDADVINSQHMLICALQELGTLVLRLGTSAAPLVAEPATDIIESVISVLIHPCGASRLAASWCLSSIAVALPSHLTPLLNRCIDRMDKLKSSPEAVSGYSSAIAALLGGVYQCPLGIPHGKGKQIVTLAEELLRTASQNSRLSLQRTQSGWLLLGAFMTLGSAVVKGHLPRMLLLWRNAFPRSSKELESEKARGDSFTWQVTLEGRAGALAAVHSFLLHCPELVTEDIIRRLLVTLECGLSLLAHMATVIKMYGSHLKATAAMVRLRLFDLLCLLPASSFEHIYTSLLRELVAEFTLTDNLANTTTSLLRSLCHVDDSVILGSWLQETDHKAIEDQLQPNSASGSGSMEHNTSSLYMRCPASDPIPGPLPLGVAVIDSSVKLYGMVFPRVAHKHRYQMLNHFIECIRQAKSSRHEAVQINIFTAVLCALKNLSETKTNLGPPDVTKAAFTLILGALSSPNPILRCAAGEALGRMAQVVGDHKFIAEMAQHSFDRLKSARDVISRTGHSLALGCLHRYVGGMGSGQHLNTSISILLALAQDFNAPIVQVWALHALALIADSGGPMFRSYVEPTMSLVLQLLLAVPPSSTDVHQCLGKCLSSLITSLGPELQLNSASKATARLYCLICCAVMQDHSDSLVQAEAISCLQQLHMFAPRHVNLSNLVPHLCTTLASSHLLLRRASVACLRQLATQEAREVIEHALNLARDSKENQSNMTEMGLEGALFGMLDKEVDIKLISDIHDTLVSLLQSLATENLTRWLILLKDILSASTDSSALRESMVQGADHEALEKDEDEDIDVKFEASEVDVTHPVVAPRWPTKVFAIECLQKIITACQADNTHFDLPKAKELKLCTGRGDYLVLHLSELIRMVFIAATSDNNQLRLSGLAALQDIISHFASIPEPEFEGHVILEQYQAQVGAALRPAFSPETSSDVTAAACDVCSAWIGCGVARDLNDLRRVHQLLTSSLAKLKSGKSQSSLYNESATTMEKLAVLRAWADVYIVAKSQEKLKTASKSVKDGDMDDYSGESLLSLVHPELPALSLHWLAALRDHALLSLPQEYSSQLPPEGGAFYQAETMETARIYYRKSWSSILYAVSIWLDENGFQATDNVPANMDPNEVNENRLYLILGICMEALSNSVTVLSEDVIANCLNAIVVLLSSEMTLKIISSEIEMSRELINVMHRLLLTKDSLEVHSIALDVVKKVIMAHVTIAHDSCVQTENEDRNRDIGDGGSDGLIVPGSSITFAALEVCLCVLVRHIPGINPKVPSTGFNLPSSMLKITDKAGHLIAMVVTIMAELPNLCSPLGSVSILPTVLHLITQILKELGTKSNEYRPQEPITACLSALKSLCSSPKLADETCSKSWRMILQSTLATVLDFCKLAENRPQIDEGLMTLTLAVLLVSAPEEVTHRRNLVISSVDVFNRAWDSNNNETRIKCLQALQSILQHDARPISTYFIHSLAPTIIEHMKSPSVSRPQSDPQLTIAIESIRMSEILLNLTDDSKVGDLLNLVVPLFVSFLLDDKSISVAGRHARSLHGFTLSELMKIGPSYPEHFRLLMSGSPHLKSRLEMAISLNQSNKLDRKLHATSKATSPLPVKQPTITLKTDFSDFKG